MTVTPCEFDKETSWLISQGHVDYQEQQMFEIETINIIITGASALVDKRWHDIKFIF